MTRKLGCASGRDASGCGDDGGAYKAGSGRLKRKRSGVNERAEKPKMTLRSHKNKTLDGPADIDAAALEAFRQPEGRQLSARHKVATDVLIPLPLCELDEGRQQDTEAFLENWVCTQDQSVQPLSAVLCATAQPDQKHTAQVDDETVTCCVCIDDGDGGPNNPLIICDGPGCEVLVHAGRVTAVAVKSARQTPPVTLLYFILKNATASRRFRVRKNTGIVTVAWPPPQMLW
ncbi:MAG: hypothetical protein BJ554DRAFT_7141 [Olpidium bornovanus]|uniref:Uncharacterized protein n=1 Tax=Olpidium bornovanus TaxID=278681 RepID=A0A8H7ZWJ9_9FUNG|nr:MAG: hypothetical protein BJ554DRAFT_7141 [Olpidium bornovanus]